MSVSASGSIPGRARFPWLQACVLLAALGLLLLFGVEIGARLYSVARGDLSLRPDQGVQGEQGLYRLDPDAGYAMNPNARLRLVTAEYDQVLETNSRGLVGPELPAKAGDEFRVVVLGDSYTVGSQVPYEQNYTAVLERLLHQAGHPNVRIVNVASGGWSTFNQAGFLRANRAWLQPDLVVVASFLGNDIAENVFATRGGYQLTTEHRDGLTWGPDAADLLRKSDEWFPSNGVQLPPDRSHWRAGDPMPTPVPNPPSAPAAATVPARRSTPAPITDPVLAAKDFLRQHSVAYRLLIARPQRVHLNLSSFEWLLLRDYPDTYWVELAWPLAEQYLVQIQETAAASNAPTVLMLIPHPGQFDDRAHREMLDRYDLDARELDLDRPQREFRQRAEAHAIPVLDLLPAFRAHPQRAELYLRRDTHFTALGHQATAEQLAAFLEPLVPPATLASASSATALALARRLHEALERLTREGRLTREVPPRERRASVEALREDCRRGRGALQAEETIPAHLVMAACLNMESDDFLAAPEAAMAKSYLELALSGATFAPKSTRAPQ
ncbi:MAG: SGNH/GDSL hydrolase family protein [Chloroflexi bacterium]|nr:SGNH/GDSL hydrolase family protein [Chloroflexota bacterium]